MKGRAREKERERESERRSDKEENKRALEGWRTRNKWKGHKGIREKESGKQ